MLPFYDSCQALAEDIRAERMRQVIRKIVEVNFGVEAAEERCPKLGFSRLQPRNLEQIAKTIALLSPLGFTLTEREDQEDVREYLGFAKIKLPNDLDEKGIPRAELEQVLAEQGLDPATLAAIVAALPADVGVKRNRVPPGEGGGLGL
jgi:hypothetical protein